MNPLYRFSTFILRLGFRFFYHFRLFGKENLPTGKSILAPNHTSLMDPPLMMRTAWPEEVHFLAHTHLFTFFSKTFLKAFNAHPTKDLHSFRVLQQLLCQDKKVVIFPEGGISRTGELIPFHTGLARLALRTRSPIIPTYISGTFQAWPRTHSFPRFGHPIVCVFGKPIAIEPFLKSNAKEASQELTTIVRHKIEALKQWSDNGCIGNIPS
ncbi:lysophospholipid acyltransferase family protein [Candidatus Protochlamydia sp. W-9]|uniref:lysophospholipid acyltransferase family protein n=1 Tax=Candidatus Protochlamydia sp. W-9 TaxID=1785087 RepID=UPI00096A55E6|nr:lysophospholipid acyltransferase family protein [Candidatus Protochlamydia sp. W-9]